MSGTGTISVLIHLLRSARLDLSSEKRAQSGFEQLLSTAEIPFEREVALSSSDIVDFLVAGVGIELKLRGARKKDVYRQLSRYALHDRIESVILATSLSMGLPDQIAGKDAYFVRLGEGWL